MSEELPTIWHVPDDLWSRLEPLLVVDKPRKKSGRPPTNTRRIFDGLIFLARTGSQWSALPPEFGPKSTAHDRFTDWVEHGCLQQAWAVLLEEYGEVVGIEWEWQSADGCIIKAPLGKRGPRARTRRPGATPPTEASPAANATC